MVHNHWCVGFRLQSVTCATYAWCQWDGDHNCGLRWHTECAISYGSGAAGSRSLRDGLGFLNWVESFFDITKDDAQILLKRQFTSKMKINPTGASIAALEKTCRGTPSQSSALRACGRAQPRTGQSSRDRPAHAPPASGASTGPCRCGPSCTRRSGTTAGGATRTSSLASIQILKNLIQNLCGPRSGENFSKPQWEPACWPCITPIPIVPQPHFPSLRRSANADRFAKCPPSVLRAAQPRTQPRMRTYAVYPPLKRPQPWQNFEKW